MHRILAEKEIYIVGASRTPVGALDGCLAEVRAPRLGSAAIRGALEKAGMQAGDVDEVFLGNVVTGGLGQGPAKQASVGAGVPEDVPATLVNTVCSSAMTALMMGVNSMLVGNARVVVAGGMESRSTAPYLLGPKLPDGSRLPGRVRGDQFVLRPKGKAAEDCEWLLEAIGRAGLREANIFDGLVCPFNSPKMMIDYAMAYADSRGWTPALVDEFAAESYAKADRAQAAGHFDDEITPVGEARKDDLVPEERRQALKEWSNSTCSPYNCPSLGDNGAAVILAEGVRMRELRLKPMARLVAYGRVDCGPADFVTAPVRVVEELRSALATAGKSADWPIMEVNESFGVQLPLFAETWPQAVINVHGGAVALKHPLGSAGARILVTLLYAMKRYRHPCGVAAVCFGSGGAAAVAVENLA